MELVPVKDDSHASRDRPWRLADATFADIKAQSFEVAVLPLGCTEPHNLHLPYSQDTRQGDLIGDAICDAACDSGARVVLLPTIPYGTVSNQRECPLSINIAPSTLNLVVRDIVASLVGHGVRKVLLLNSHGGNDLKPLLRELHGQTDARLFLCNWYQMVRDIYGEIFEHPDDHAGEMETSIALAHWPELVGRNADGTLAADDGAGRPTRFEAVNRGWVSITRPWHLLTTNTGLGFPHAATAQKGQRVVAVMTERLGRFLAELSAAELDDHFPF